VPRRRLPIRTTGRRLGLSFESVNRVIIDSEDHCSLRHSICHRARFGAWNPSRSSGPRIARSTPRDIDATVELMHPEVDWPNAWEGGRMIGRQGGS
jgi:hypothetical protein